MKVLINTNIGDDATAFLRGKGIDLLQYIPPEQVRTTLLNCDGYIVGTTARVDAAVLEDNTRLKVVARLGSGLDNVDLEACKRLGIKVVYTPDAPVAAVAELTVGLMLDVARRISLADRGVRRGEWPPAVEFAGTLLRGKTVGIVGVGRIGSEVARLLFGFRVEMLGHDSRPDQNAALLTGLTFVDKDEILARSDFLLLHLPLTAETRGWLGDAELEKMKATAYLINTARGGLIDEGALEFALTQGWIAGAALDVFAEEPYTGPLAAFPNVVLTRHMGSCTAATRQQMARQAAEGCWIVLAGIDFSDTRKDTWRLAN